MKIYIRGENMKVCNTCKRKLPSTPEYFYRFKHSKDGFKSSCKECQGGKFTIKENIKEGYKKCTDCKNVLPETEEFYLKYLDKRYNKYRFKSHCLECGKIRSKQWREENEEQYIDYYLEYNKTDKAKGNKQRYRENNQETIKAYKRDYRERNKHKIQAYNKKRRYSPKTRSKVLDWSRKWRENNPDKVKNYNSQYAKENKDYFVKTTQKRNAKLKELDYTLTLEEWEDTKKYFNNQCSYCGKSLKRLTQDHFIPLSDNGSYTKDNIIPSCKSCNSSKNNRDFKEWYKTYKYYDEERERKILNYINDMAIPR